MRETDQRLAASIAVALALGLGACQFSGTSLCDDRRCAPPGSPDAGGAGGGACHADFDCRLGAICDGVRCVAGCRSTRDCPPDQSCDLQHQPYGACLGAATVPDASTPTPDAAPVADAELNGDGSRCGWMSLLVNAGFEDGRGVAWEEHPAHGTALIFAPSEADSVQPYQGHYLARLGTFAATESITQSFTLPAHIDRLDVGILRWITTSEIDPSGYDEATVELTVPGRTLLLMSNLDASTYWVHAITATDLSGWGGWPSSVVVKMTNDSTRLTSIYLDDVTLSARVCQ